ncbi:DUF3566 domain-containing protein [Brevibacterium sp.]|uniref:DUF3566 domain-containing protein n=1 Tax=Brevibacterium sp. TaxID=1701 RepID=UPI00281130D9|nr:DUF3566 domain-containing protein [Brevibacterium sp.]
MSENKKPGSGKIIRTSSGSTRLTAGSATTEDKPETPGGSPNGQPAGPRQSPAPRQSSGGQSPTPSAGAKSAKTSGPPTVVAPPAPKAAPQSGSGPASGSGSTTGSGPTTGAGSATGGGAQTTGSQPSGGQQTGSGGNAATSKMAAAANTVRASSGGVKMGVKNMVESGKGKKKKGPRTVRLTVSAIDPWSVMKMSFLISVAIGIATIVAFIVLWIVLQATGVMSSMEATMTELAGAESAERLLGIFAFGRVVAAGFIIAVINIVLLTALSTLAAFLYNIGSLIAGGFHLTLTDD